MSDVRRERWRVRIALGLVIFVAAALRLTGLHYSLWNDEVASVEFAKVPVRLLWSDWMIRETNPPLYYTVLHGWMMAVGNGDGHLRLLTALIGCLDILLVFALGRRVGGAWTGTIAAALVALSAQNILYSQQVRAYILADAGAVAAITGAIVFLDAVHRPTGDGRRAGGLALYLGGAAVAIYSHTTLLLLPALTGVFVLARLVLPASRAVRPVEEWIATNALLLLAAAWWVRITILQAETRSTIGWIATPSLPYAIRMTLESFLPWQIGPAQYLVAVLATAAAAWGTWQWRDRPDYLLLPFLAVGLPVLLYAASIKVPMFLDRTVYWASAPFLVTVAAGIARLQPRGVAIGAAGIAVVASVAGWATWFPARETEPWQDIAESLDRQYPGMTVLTQGIGPTLALRRYCRPPGCSLRIIGVRSPSIDTWASGFSVPGMVGKHEAADILKRRGSIVAIRWMAADPMAMPPPTALARPIVIGYGHADNIGATLWRVR
ncbi:glycosyltransferase family 39 protein [Sphingomonas bacterium]|uniref:glycosyltransferase family 39 protein n=1 Tax=Sphingomonas bacterium TaxID=1895847 RepID=UPI0015773B2B|nr:glycosyltransferase family 39 protein [Sphingomonas bacterium]